MTRILLAHFILLLLGSCSNQDLGDDVPGNGSHGNGKVIDGWSVPIRNVLDAGVGKDGIRSLELPPFLTVNQVNYLADDELVIGLKLGNEIRAYPQRIMDLHEVANDTINGGPISITFCPLTGSAIGIDGMVNGQKSTFGVSGFLYNSNLIIYDRLTDSRWGQMLQASINGPRVCDIVSFIPVVETKWSTWKEMYPHSKVLDIITGHDRRYQNPPFSSLVSLNNDTTVPVDPVDNRLPNYQRVHGIIVGELAVVFQFDQFGDKTGVLRESIAGQNWLVVGNKQNDFIVSFELSDNEIGIEFQPLENGGEVIMTDKEGNLWNIFGEAIEGPRTGQKLKATRSYMGYWFAWSSIFPNPILSVTESD